ncbi:hypothetical protein PoB_003781000 [Plakobranchus ocellatus]|uniref:Uncharacterized protein n=1 Tax=Plakobranchus ocellatus TaxID=259542 RepID=A0AAV4ASM2_9GAST|nr:hypothetical protein PoB_003781000 [Plakobranchus ocellatus]
MRTNPSDFRAGFSNHHATKAVNQVQPTEVRTRAHLPERLASGKPTRPDICRYFLIAGSTPPPTPDPSKVGKPEIIV